MVVDSPLIPSSPLSLLPSARFLDDMVTNDLHRWIWMLVITCYCVGGVLVQIGLMSTIDCLFFVMVNG